MPVVVVTSAEAPDVMDDDVVGADLDLAVTAGTAVELARDPANEPRLVTLVGEADEAGAAVG